MTTAPVPTVAEAPHKFDSARDAIDAVSAFEADTLEEWEYEIRCVDEEGRYTVRAVSLCRIHGKLVRGYLRGA